MNGEVNGTVEDPSEMPMADPEPAHSTKLTTSEDCNADVNNSETSVAETNHKNDANIESTNVECPINGTDTETAEAPCDSEKSETPNIEGVSPKVLGDSNKLENHCNSIEDACNRLQESSQMKSESCEKQEVEQKIDTNVNITANTTADITADATVDTAVDAAVDTNVDTAVDTTVDTTVDTAVDAAVDTNVDTAVDTNVDTAVDTTVDTTVDTAVDTNVGAVQDPEEGDQSRLETSEIMESDGIHSIVGSSDESEVSAGPRAEDTVSINSDSGAEGGDDTSQESQTKLKSSELIIVGKEKKSSNQNGKTCGSPSPEVKNIVNDKDRSEKQIKSAKVPETKVPLRRSSRAIKRKRYDSVTNGDDDSDIEEISEPYRRRRPIVINDTKALVEMAARQMKSIQSSYQKKEPTVVIIDTNSTTSGKMSTGHHQYNKHSASSSTSTMSAQSLYQSIVARGTTVTPVSSKANASTQSPQALILPSLTDDMFVVEAPSFIVPYVYEKPSIKPFREFVDVLGNELAEQRAKEEKAEQEKREQEKKDKIARGELVENSEEESVEKVNEKDKTISTEKEPTEKGKDNTETEENETDEEKKKKKTNKRQRRKRQNDDDDMSWDGESSLDSDDEVGSDEEDKTVVIKDKVDAVTDLKNVTDLTVEKIVTGKSDNYFDCSLGKFFMNIGLNLVQEYVQTDLLKQQNRKLYKEKKTGHDTKPTEISIMSLRKNLEFSKDNNAPYSFPLKKCEQCSFKSESSLVVSHHMETPHMKNNIYKCNYCTFEIRSPHDILFHMEAQHNVRGRLERAPSYHLCPNCPFEDNGKGKLVRHQIACAKKFKPELNLSPPVEWEPPAKIPKQMSRSRNQMMNPYHNSFQRGTMINNVRPTIGQIIQGATGYRPRGRSPMNMPPRSTVVHGTPIMRGGVMIRHSNPNLLNNYPIGNNGKNIPLPKTMHQPSISITPLPRQSAPPAPVPIHNPPKNSCVICEICDGYIKDLEQLRNHMQWIHKVKIHPKMIYNRPPLNCQKCQFRFFTDQGLERHLLGSHGLVTSSMQDAANKGKDAGRCPVCGRIYQWKLLNHVSRDHSLTLKPAHLSYKCTVCTATFGMYKLFENHVYSAHSVVAKRAIDKSKAAPAPASASASTSASSAAPKQTTSLLKPLKINDEITIIPQPVKPTTSSSEGKDK